MRVCMVSALALFSCTPAWAQTAPAGWKTIKDAKAACQIAVPPDWVPFSENSGAAVFHDSTTAIAVVTSQPGQAFKPLSAAILKVIGIAKEQVFENSTARIFYQDKTSGGPEDTSGFSISVPAGSGTCSCHVLVLPSIPDDVVKKIAHSLSPAPDKT